MASEVLLLKILGLYTNSNPFSEAPEGGLARADNIVLTKDSIAECRRGFTRLAYRLPDPSDRADKLFEYDESLLIHYDTDKLGYYDGLSGVQTYSGTYLNPNSLYAKIRAATSNQNFYFTTSVGIKKLDDIANTPTIAGMPKGLDALASPSVNLSGFMPDNSQVAYQVVWGRRDFNNNLVIGAPSQRAVITNSSGGAQDVSLQITVPSEVTTADFFQAYRSDISVSSATEPNANMRLVYEASPTSGQIAAKSVTFIDGTPDSLRGADAYWNSTQEGILQSNDQPPYATDIALFRGSLFFSETQSFQQILLTILAIAGSSGIALNDVLTIAGTTYTAKSSESVGSREFELFTSGSAAQNITDTSLSLIRVINQNAANTTVYAYYVSEQDGLPGRIRISARAFGGSPFYLLASAHSGAYYPNLPTTGTTVASSNDSNPNGLMWSKTNIPGAVPVLNIEYIGSASKRIMRIAALRDSLFVFKDDGIFRVTGTYGNFTVELLDNTAPLIAPESVSALNNKLYALTTQGVVAVSDAGVEVVSRKIEDQLISLFSSSRLPMSYYSFGVGYESEREYILWTVSGPSSTYADQAFVYNVFTEAWTRWDRKQQFALVFQTEDQMYALDPLSSYINKERKDGTFSDFADEAFEVAIVSFDDYEVELDSIEGIVVGDMLFQSNSVAALIVEINASTNVVTVDNLLSDWDPLTDAFILTAISCLIEWLPNAAGNPGTLKQWSEVSFLFRQAYFNFAEFGFYTDISGSVAPVEIAGTFGGGWGRFPWGLQPWGGVSRAAPIRTYIPLEKQRADLLSVRFEVRAAWSRFQLLGASLVARGISPKVNK